MLPLFKGIDISKHQPVGTVNFSALKGLGYHFVMLRAGFGSDISQKDKAFENHYKAAKEAGLRVGAYHYSYAVSPAEAEREADCFLEWIRDKKLDYPVAFDIEDKVQKKLTNPERTAIALAFMQKVEAAGYYTMLYSSASWLGTKFDSEKLRHFDVWVAAYVGSYEKIARYYRGKFGMWQYSSSVILPSVHRSRLDHNNAYKNYEKIIKNAKLNHLEG